MTMKKWVGLLQASQVVAYVAGFTVLVTNGEKIFSQINENFAPLMFLTLFCFSVLVCGLIVFYRPYLLFLEKKPKEAVGLVLSTTKWLGLYALAIIVLVILFSR